MKKTITSAILFLLLTVNSAFAQFTADDVVFWVGEGNSEAVLVIDFRDGTTDPSFAWGYRFNAGEGKSFADMLLAVEAADPNLDVVINGGFLSSIYYNSHSGIDSQPDWWSTWSGTGLESLSMNGGTSETLIDGSWYGTSYGFMNPEPTQPTVTYPAYSSLWFTADEFTYSIGEGTNSAVIVVDFVDDEDVSFAWKINFDGTITPQQALELIAQNDANFEIVFNGTDSTVTYGDLTANLWTAYNGTNLSDWVVGDFTTAIENNNWFGVSAGDDVRRPFTPIPAPENPFTEEPTFTSDDIVFWVGEGDSEAVLVIDFRDGTTDPSFAWGYRFNASEEKTFADMLLAVEAAEPELDVVINSGFLSSVYYNSHSGIDSQPDWWSTWSGTSLENLSSNMGISEILVDGNWYGTSYGFTPEAVKPTVTYPAYNSLWFIADELIYSIGEGTDLAVIVIDFVDGEGVSFAWQINFDGTITPQAALELIAQNDTEFEIVFNGENSTVTYGDLTADFWTAYNGTNLSDWVVGDFTTAIENNDWFGISAGDNLRRPFTPVPAPENSASTGNFNNITLSVYPNPATDFFTVTSDNNIKSINVFNLSGQKVFTQFVNNTSETVSTNNLTTGLYLVEIATDNGTSVQKLVIK